VLFPRDALQGIAAGRIDLAFRRWERARVKPGTRQRTAVGVIEVTGVEVVEPGAITADDARRAGFDKRDRLLRTLERRNRGPVHRIELRWAGEDPRVALRNQAALTPEDTAAITRRLDRMDRKSRSGPWTRNTLEAIRAHPATRAAELAASLGRETQPFKRDVRKLKELGLTESLELGYRLSPRGEAYLAASRRTAAG
jgi:hypothetical protein